MESVQYTETKPLVSVVLRSYNEEAHIRRLLESVFRQKTDFPFEVILVDSGSTDSTVEIATRFPVKVIAISKDEFTFGRSLNKGIEKAIGDFCVMTSSHCFASDDYWLQNIILPFQYSDVVLVYGKQRGVTSTKYSEHQMFEQLFPENNIEDFQLPFCNNANAAIRKSIWKEYKFNEDLTGLEDVDWAKYVRNKGYKISYRADACIFHVHEETPKQIYNRYYREAYAYKQIFKDQRFGLRSFIKFFLLNVYSDLLHAKLEGSFIKNFTQIIQFRFLQFWGTYRAHQFKIPVSHEMQKQLFYPKNRQSNNTLKKSKNKKALSIVDITRPITTEMAVWPGASTTRLIERKNFSDDGFSDCDLFLNIHAATHIDAPSHFVRDGKTVDEISLEKLNGHCFVYETTSFVHINAFELERARIPKATKRLIIKTANSSRPLNACFNEHFIAITEDAARWIVEKGIEVVGIDGPSIQAFEAKTNQTHIELLKNEVVIVENLYLNQVGAGHYRLHLYPLPIKGAEGSPARVLLTKN